MNVNELIMNKRIERGVSRKELAEGLGVSESTIYRIETNPNLNPNNKLVTSKSIIFKTIAKEEKMKKLKEK